MVESRAAERYAKSLIELSSEQKQLDKVYADVKLIDSAIEGSKDLRMMLKSPIINHYDKQKVMDKIFGDKVQKLTQSFFALITKNKREELTQGIVKSFIRQYDIIRGIQKAVLTTTYKVPDNQKKLFEELVKEISGKKPDLSMELDDSIIGGFVLNIGDRQIDASIKSKLKEIEFELTT